MEHPGESKQACEMLIDASENQSGRTSIVEDQKIFSMPNLEIPSGQAPDSLATSIQTKHKTPKIYEINKKCLQTQTTLLVNPKSQERSHRLSSQPID